MSEHQDNQREGTCVVSWSDCMELLERLPHMTLAERCSAYELLVRNPSPEIRQAALRIGASVLSEEQLVGYLRNDEDDVLRNAALEILKMRGKKSLSLAIRLLQDSDEDVVLEAVLALDSMGDGSAVTPLRALLRHPNVNVAQAAIVALGHLGDPSVAEDLLSMLNADLWLQMAAVKALGDLRAEVAVPSLKKLLRNPFLGPFAAEALGKIATAPSVRFLIRYWLKREEQQQEDYLLAVVADSLEKLKRKIKIAGLQQALIRRLEWSENVSVPAARCLLVTGPEEGDDKALEILSSRMDASRLPVCLKDRWDLIPRLLIAPAPQPVWGIHLCSLYPSRTPVSLLTEALSLLDETDLSSSLIQSLSRLRHPDVIKAVWKLYLRLSDDGRMLLIPYLQKYKKVWLTFLKERQDLDKETRLILRAYLEPDVASVAKDLLEQQEPLRSRIISQISSLSRLMRLLPWKEWIRENPEQYADLAAEVAANSRLKKLLPDLRAALKKYPGPSLIRTLGDFADQKSVPILEEHLTNADPLLRAVILETLGRIGGLRARKILHDLLPGSDLKEKRILYRSLACLASEQDNEIFRRAAEDQDWMVRLCSAEVLVRFPHPENMAALAKLAADPVAVVSEKATSALG